MPAGDRTRASRVGSEHCRKGHLDSLFAGYSETLLGLPVQQPVLYNASNSVSLNRQYLLYLNISDNSRYSFTWNIFRRRSVPTPIYGSICTGSVVDLHWFGFNADPDPLPDPDLGIR